jgi:exodeoxyribonuclease VII large subunit
MLQLTVSEFNHVFADIVHHQLHLKQLCIQGEITQLNMHREHLYVTLSHAKAHLPCVIYSTHTKNLPYVKKGDTCQIIGHGRYLKNKGQFVFSGHTILPKGTGQKTSDRARLMRDYEVAGKYQHHHPEAIPKKLYSVALITATDSAAYHDMASVFHRTHHTLNIQLIPAVMQGLKSPASLITALNHAEALSPDVIALARGGGAEHDFDGYFSTELANALLALTTPIVCGIGHQINTTLCCKIAHRDFETPTAMAQWLCDASMAPIRNIEHQLTSLHTHIMTRATHYLSTLSGYHTAAKHAIQTRQTHLLTLEQTYQDTLRHLNPIRQLSRGFVYAETMQNTPVTSTQSLKKNDKLQLRLADGTVKVTIDHVN